MIWAGFEPNGNCEKNWGADYDHFFFGGGFMFSGAKFF
jgi:hypothetical protein